MELMFQPLKKYADFQGRARRKEYWLFYLFYIVVYCVMFTMAMAGSDASAPAGGPGLIVLIVFVLAMVLPSLAVGVRRLHDTNRSGWWLFISLIPLIGAIALLVFLVLDGTPGPNRFGPDPKGRGADQVAEAFA